MTMPSILNLKYCFRHKRLQFLIVVALCFAHSLAFAQEALLTPKSNSELKLDFDSIKSWKEFSAAETAMKSQEQSEGIAYMASGLLVVVAGAVGYSSASTNIEKFACSLSESIGVAGIGYGAHRYHIGSESRTFYEVLAEAKTISDAQKDDLVRNYVALKKDQQKSNRWIRIITHSLIAGFNLYQASHESTDWTKAAYTVIGSANALAVISLTF